MKIYRKEPDDLTDDKWLVDKHESANVVDVLDTTYRLELDQDTTADSYSSSQEREGNEASKAFDGDEETLWKTVDQTTDAWVKVDFGNGNTRTITRLEILSSNSTTQAKNFYLQGSNNDSDWTTLLISTKLLKRFQISSQMPKENAWNEWDVINSTAYRYYRIFCLDNWGGSSTTIYEILLVEGGYRVSEPLSLDDIKKVKSSNIKWTSTEPTDTDIKIYTAVNDSDTVEPKGGALEFDGSNYVIISEQYTSLTSIKVEAWIKGSSQDNNRIITQADFGEDKRRWEIISGYSGNNAGDTDKFRVSIFAAPDSAEPRKEYTSQTVVLDNTWHKIGFEFIEDATDGTLKLYVDDEEVNVVKNLDGTVEELNNTSVALMFGGYGPETGPTAQFEGELSEVKIEDGNENLVGYWKLNEGSGTTAGDSADTNDGTLLPEGGEPEWITDVYIYLYMDEATDDASIPSISTGEDLTGKYLWVRQYLETEDTAETPRLTDLEVEIVDSRGNSSFFKFF